MKPPTNAFRVFKSSLAESKRIAQRVPKNLPTTKLHDLKTRSLIILAHAAVEQYLEEVSTEIASASVALFKQNGSVNVPLIALVTHHKSNISDLAPYPRALPVRLREALTLAADDALDKQLSAVDGNHGIKIGNHNKLLHPIGIDLKRVDPLLPALLDGFGGKRGGVAHAMQIQVQHTRADIESDLRNIFRCLRGLDAALCRAFRSTVHRI